jgi:predicted histone-like DNA-binding protein
MEKEKAKIIQYDVYENPTPEGKQKSFHVRPVSHGVTSFKEVAEYIEVASSATAADVISITSSLSRKIGDILSHGGSVHIQGLGYFSPKIHADTFYSWGKISSKKIKIAGVNFRPDKELLDQLKDCTFQRATAGNRSIDSTTDALAAGLIEFFKTHKSITRHEFQYLFKFTKPTAVRRLASLCEGDNPLLLREGIKCTIQYVLNPKFDSTTPLTTR